MSRGVLLTPCGPFDPPALHSNSFFFFFMETNYSHIKNYLCKGNIDLHCPFLIISVLKSREKPCGERLGLELGTGDQGLGPAELFVVRALLVLQLHKTTSSRSGNVSP